MSRLPPRAELTPRLAALRREMYRLSLRMHLTRDRRLRERRARKRHTPDRRKS